MENEDGKEDLFPQPTKNIGKGIEETCIDIGRDWENRKLKNLVMEKKNLYDNHLIRVLSFEEFLKKEKINKKKITGVEVYFRYLEKLQAVA